MNLIFASLIGKIVPSAWAVAIPAPSLGGPFASDLQGSLSSVAGEAAVIVGGVLVLMFIYYGMKILLSGGDESKQSEVKEAFAHALFGVAMIGGATVIANSFPVVGGTIVDNQIETGLINPVVDFISYFVAAALLFTIVYQAIRMIIAQDENSVSTARKKLIQGMIGAAIVILARRLADAFQGADSAILPAELAGIARFIATVFGFVAVLAILISGVILVISINDDLRDTARKMIINSIVGLVVIYAAYSLVSIFIA